MILPCLLEQSNGQCLPPNDFAIPIEFRCKLASASQNGGYVVDDIKCTLLESVVALSMLGW